MKVQEHEWSQKRRKQDCTTKNWQNPAYVKSPQLTSQYNVVITQAVARMRKLKVSNYFYEYWIDGINFSIFLNKWFLRCTLNRRKRLAMLALMTDCWTSRSTDSYSYINFTSHFIDDKFPETTGYLRYISNVWEAHCPESVDQNFIYTWGMDDW